MIRKSVADEHPVARQHHLVNRVIADQAFVLHRSWAFSGLQSIAHLKLKRRLPSRGVAFERMCGAASLVDLAAVQFNVQLETETRLVGDEFDVDDLIRSVWTGHAFPSTK